MSDSTSSSTLTPETVKSAGVVEQASKKMAVEKRKVVEAAEASVHREAKKRRSSEPNIRSPKPTHFSLKTIEPFSPALLSLPARTESRYAGGSTLFAESTPLFQSCSQYLGSDEPHSLIFDDLPPVEGPCQRIRECYQAYERWTRRISQSVWMIAVYVALMAFSCHACFMGFHSDCKWLVSLPEVYVVMGLSSFFVELSRIITVLHKTCYPHSTMFSTLKRCNTTAFGIAIVFFSLSYFLELLMFFLKPTDPSFTLGSETYCDPSFYKYVKCTNWIIPVVILIMAVLHGP